MGVWIETGNVSEYYTIWASHPAWVCGLKLNGLPTVGFLPMSHPAWVCGLKQFDFDDESGRTESHPAWVCGLKLMDQKKDEEAEQVTPCVGVWIETWVCRPKWKRQSGHTLRGCVD